MSKCTFPLLILPSICTNKKGYSFHFSTKSTLLEWSYRRQVKYESDNTQNRHIILSKLFILPMTIKLDKIDSDISRHCDSPSVLLQLTEQYMVYYMIILSQKKQKINVYVCVLLRSMLNGDVQQNTTIVLFWLNIKSHSNGRINSNTLKPKPHIPIPSTCSSLTKLLYLNKSWP